MRAFAGRQILKPPDFTSLHNCRELASDDISLPWCHSIIQFGFNCGRRLLKESWFSHMLEVATRILLFVSIDSCEVAYMFTSWSWYSTVISQQGEVIEFNWSSSTGSFGVCYLSIISIGPAGGAVSREQRDSRRSCWAWCAVRRDGQQGQLRWKPRLDLSWTRGRSNFTHDSPQHLCHSALSLSFWKISLPLPLHTLKLSCCHAWAGNIPPAGLWESKEIM